MAAPEAPSVDEAKQKKQEPVPWSSAITSGLVSGIIAGVSAAYAGALLFVVWMVCFILFLSWLKPLNRKLVAIAIMLVLGSLISAMIQNPGLLRALLEYNG